MPVQVGPQSAPDDGLVGFEHITTQPKRVCRKFRSVQVLHQTEQPSAIKSPSLSLTSLRVAADLSLFVMRSRRPCRARAATEGVVRGYGKPAGESRACAWRSQPSSLPEWREVDPIRGIPASRTIMRPKLARGRLIAEGDAQRRLCFMDLWR
jgi:hypothetical protein